MDNASRILQTLDLILTKMMRGDDPQDMADIAFLKETRSFGQHALTHLTIELIERTEGYGSP